MSEEKKVAAKETKQNWFTKAFAWIKKLPRSIAKPFKSMWYELKKVTWPSKQKLIACSVIVLVFMVFMSIVVGLLDMGASALVRLLV